MLSMSSALRSAVAPTVVAVLLTLPVAAAAQPRPVAIEAFSPDPAALAPDALPGSYAVRLDGSQLAAAREAVLGGSFVSASLPVSPGVALDLVFTEVSPTGRGYSLIGFVADPAAPPGFPAQPVFLTVSGEIVAGDVHSRFGGWSLSGSVGFDGVVVRPHASPAPDAPNDAVMPFDVPVRQSHRPEWVEPNRADLLLVFARRAR